MTERKKVEMNILWWLHHFSYSRLLHLAPTLLSWCHLWVQQCCL